MLGDTGNFRRNLVGVTGGWALVVYNLISSCSLLSLLCAVVEDVSTRLPGPACYASLQNPTFFMPCLVAERTSVLITGPGPFSCKEVTDNQKSNNKRTRMEKLHPGLSILLMD